MKAEREREREREQQQQKKRRSSRAGLDATLGLRACLNVVLGATCLAGLPVCRLDEKPKTICLKLVWSDDRVW